MMKPIKFVLFSVFSTFISDTKYLPSIEKKGKSQKIEVENCTTTYEFIEYYTQHPQGKSPALLHNDNNNFVVVNYTLKSTPYTNTTILCVLFIMLNF